MIHKASMDENRKDWDFLFKWAKCLSHLFPHTFKCENKVNNFNCRCLPARIVIPKEHVKIDWNNIRLKREKPQKWGGEHMVLLFKSLLSLLF